MSDVRQKSEIAPAPILQDGKEYPPLIRDRLGDGAPRCLYGIGDATILRNRLLGLVCSIQCPGSVVIKTFDAVRALRDAGVVVAGGFHSPMERECLHFLLRGEQPVVLCVARGLGSYRLDPEHKEAVEDRRLLVLSPFAETYHRTTAAQAVERNNVVAAMSQALWVPHASPSGKTWTTVRAALARAQPVYTFDDEENAELLKAAVNPFEDLDCSEFTGETGAEHVDRAVRRFSEYERG